MKYFRFIKLAIYLVIGILLGIYHEFAVNNLKYTLTSIMIIYGIEAISFAVYYHRKNFYHQHRFYWGAVEILLALVVLTSVNELEVICVVWAIWAILREANEIREAVETFKNFITSLILIGTGIINVVFSVLLIIHPGIHHATIHLYLLIVELMVASVVPIIDHYVYKVDYTG